MPFLAAAAPLIGAVAGGVGGLVSGLSGSSNNTTQMPVMPQGSALQQSLQQGLGQQYGAYENMINNGPGNLGGAGAAGAYGQSVGGLAGALQQYAAAGGMPTQQQYQAGATSAAQAFAPQQAALQQQFYYQNQSNKQNEALLGRGPADPILQARLAQSQGFQQQQLTAEQGAYGNQLAMQAPQNTLSALGQQNQLLGNVYNQALQNQQYIMSMGSNLLGQQYGYQLGSAGRSSTGTTPGTVGGAIGGALGGIGGGISAFNKLGFQYTPAQTQQQVGPWAGGYGTGSMAGGYGGG